MTTRVPGHRGAKSWQRSALLAVLAEHTSYRSVAELFTELRSRGHHVGLVTVYRHLEAMFRQGTVTTVPGRRGETRYRLRPPATGDRHPLVCTLCRRVVDVDADEVTRWATRTATEHGFVDIQVLAMVTGGCEHCRAVRAPPRRRRVPRSRCGGSAGTRRTRVPVSRRSPSAAEQGHQGRSPGEQQHPAGYEVAERAGTGVGEIVVVLALGIGVTVTSGRCRSGRCR